MGGCLVQCLKFLTDNYGALDGRKNMIYNWFMGFIIYKYIHYSPMWDDDPNSQYVRG